MSEPAAEQIVSVEPDKAPVHGYLHHAENSSDFLVLTHGAGGNCNAPLLVALAEQFAAAGVNTLRCDLPFRQRRPSGPPSPSGAKQDQEGLRRALAVLRKRFTGKPYLGGVSYGGRQASMLIASEPELVDGLLLLSYPLHPPGRAAQMRTAHFADIKDADTFCERNKGWLRLDRGTRSCHQTHPCTYKTDSHPRRRPWLTDEIQSRKIARRDCAGVFGVLRLALL